jgi:quercetin dioxygenase-like cupin family protein
VITRSDAYALIDNSRLLFCPPSSGDHAMTQSTRRCLSAATVALALILVGSASTQAQEATPASAITITVLGVGMPTAAPGQYLELDRVTFAPGATIPTHVHPGAYLLYVESGDFGFTVLKGEAQLTRAGESTPQTITAGAEVVGHAGDVFYEDAGVVHSARNAGDGPLVLLTAGLLASNMPSLMPSNAEGTPTP